MKKRIMALTVTLALAMSTLLGGCGIVKVVKIGEEGKYTGEVEFNAGDDVAAIWDESAMPELEEKAVALADEYGRYSMGDSGELSYVVKGTGTVEEVNTESQAGYMTVKLDNYSGAEEIRIQIGPVYKGSSIRDSLSFLNFNDYTNQQDWAAISQSINSLIDEEVVQAADPSSLQGASINFTGAFTVSTGSTEILITPVILEKN